MNTLSLYRLMQCVAVGLSIVLCTTFSWTLYHLFIDPLAGAVFAAGGLFLVIAAYTFWTFVGLRSHERSPLKYVLAAGAIAVSLAVIWAIHGTLENDAKRQTRSAVQHDAQQQRLIAQIDEDRKLYQDLLRPAPAVVSAERNALQESINKQQALAADKRRMNFDKPADRIDASIASMQSQLQSLIALDAQRTASQAADRQVQAQKLLVSIQAREADLKVQAVPGLGIATDSDQFVLFLSVLIESICSLLFFTAGRLRAEILVADTAEVEQVKDMVTKHTPAPVQPTLAIEEPSNAYQVLEAPAAALPSELVMCASNSSEPGPVAPASAPEPAVDLLQSQSPIVPQAQHSEAPLPLVRSAVSSNPIEAQKYESFVKQIGELPVGQPITFAGLASSLGYGKDLVSSFFKLAGAEGLIEKRGRQWFHATQAN